MSEIREAVGELSGILKGIALPQEFLENYDLLECLAQGHGTETYLAQRKGSESLCAAKCYDRKVFRTVSESRILRSLHHGGLPVFLDEYEDDAAICIVREYVEGTPLDRYAAGRCLPEAQIVSLCGKLCDILIYLHGLRPPVIHRDIKPQNVIVREHGEVSLIDFDIARTCDGAAGTDTQVIGTRAYAPPEQYGFSQTDRRADIYALGVLLCFLLTGSTDIKSAAIANKRLAAVVRRCTAFSPEERFPDAAAVKKALLASDGHKQKRLKLFSAAAALVLLSLCAGFAAGRYTDFLASPAAEGVRFAEPLIEKAVRVQLGKSETEPISEAELAAVRELYIFGGEVSKTEGAFSDGLGGPLRDTPRGTLESLEDVKLLPNLEVLYVNYQTLADLSPLSGLRYLTSVSLRHTFVEDVSPLAGMEHLSSVVLFDTRVADFSPLAGCPALQTLDAGGTPIASLDALPELPELRALSLRQTALSSLAGIERYARLERLDLCRSAAADLSPLASLPNLRTVSVDESMRGAAEALSAPAFEIKYE